MTLSRLGSRRSEEVHGIGNDQVGELKCAARAIVPNAQPKPPLNQFSRLVILGLWLGGGIPCLADDLSAIGWDQVALTVVAAVAERDGVH
jgi:hypothetical protein